jgi:hypothetical protein
LCFCCATVSAALGSALAPVVPITTCAAPGPVLRMLRGYKDLAAADGRHHFTDRLADVLGPFLAHHDACLASLLGGRPEVLVPVPPTKRPGPPPLVRVVEGAGLAAGRTTGWDWAPDVLQRGVGRLDHLWASPDGFVVSDAERARLRGRRVVLLDDTLTTGATAQSAAAAVRAAGASAVAIVVLGRVVRPAASYREARYWASVDVAPYRPDRCCITGCGSAPAPGTPSS